MHHCSNSEDSVRFNMLNPKLHLCYDHKSVNMLTHMGRNWWAKQKNEEELRVTEAILGVFFFIFIFLTTPLGLFIK